MELRQRARDAFSATDPLHKAQNVSALWHEMPHLALDTHASFAPPDSLGRPDRPKLVHPKEVSRRSPFTNDGHAALMHSIAHIEFNAINLALDALWRFPAMPAAYYLDWMRVAYEEANHFAMLRSHLQTCGYDYGDFLAHDGLWAMCEATRHDVVARMAMVPRTLEARGLDATPIIQAKLVRVGSTQALAAVAILDIILNEEVGHVAIGNHWYHWLCDRDGHDPVAYHRRASELYGGPQLKPPFNLEARRQAGFTQSELDALPQPVHHRT
jgi:uncharacterized ferritin-like protein (DUF455 family)